MGCTAGLAALAAMAPAKRSHVSEPGGWPQVLLPPRRLPLLPPPPPPLPPLLEMLLLCFSMLRCSQLALQPEIST